MSHNRLQLILLVGQNSKTSLVEWMPHKAIFCCGIMTFFEPWWGMADSHHWLVQYEHLSLESCSLCKTLALLVVVQH